MNADQLTHLTPQERAALDGYLGRLRARFADRVREVVLFGSRARGEGDAESDLDVLVVVDEADWRLHDQVALESCEPSLHSNVTISPLIWSQTHFEQQKQWGLLLYRNIEREGIVLWTNPRRARQLSNDLNELKTT